MAAVWDRTGLRDTRCKRRAGGRGWRRLWRWRLGLGGGVGERVAQVERTRQVQGEERRR